MSTERKERYGFGEQQLGKPLVFQRPSRAGQAAPASGLAGSSGVATAGASDGMGSASGRPGGSSSSSSSGGSSSSALVTNSGGNPALQRFDPSTAFQQVSQAQLMPAHDYLEHRANAVADVQSHINDLGQIFQKLAHMVHEQGGMLARYATVAYALLFVTCCVFVWVHVSTRLTHLSWLPRTCAMQGG